MYALRVTPLVDLLADLYVLSTVLLLVGLGVMLGLKQPAQRMAVARSLLAALAALMATRPPRPV